MLQNPHRCRCSERRRDLMGWPRCPWAAGGRQVETRTVPRQRNTPPPRTAPGHFRYKTRPTRTAPGHFRYKTRPARSKWPNLARFSHAWRTLYRCRQQETTHGELCTACEAETGLAITAHQGPQAWRTPEGPQGLAGLRNNAPSHTPAHRAPQVWRAPEGLAAAPVGGGGAWPGFEATHRATSATRPHWCGGRRRVRRARAGFEARRRTQ